MTDLALLDINDVFRYEASTEGTGNYTAFEVDRNGKRHRIGLHDNLAERTIDGAETGLVLQEGLHVAERHV